MTLPGLPASRPAGCTSATRLSADANPAWPDAAAGRLRPLSELSPARLRVLRGVLTDIDDTLTAHGQITPEALQALHALRAAGVPVVATTGRPAGWSERFAMAWPVAAIVAENGAVMLRRQADRLQIDFVADAATRAKDQQRLQACAQAVLAQVPGARLATDSAGRLTDIAIDHSEHQLLDAPRIQQVLALMRAHGLTATVSSIHINGWLGGHDKASGAAWAVHTVWGQAWQPADWLYVGDSTNDQAMFAGLPLTVGVANIRRFLPLLNAWPAYLTEGERGAGFAEVARALLAARGAQA